MTEGISIIICFYNAEQRLQKTLNAIKQLNVESIPFVELVLVNNNSNDHSDEIIREQLAHFTSFPWKIIQEPTPGLSHARKAGIVNSVGSYILFCDDDNWLDHNYLTIAYRLFKQNPLIGVLGGLGTATSDKELPGWFDQEQVLYAVGSQNSFNGEVSGGRNMVYGAGMTIDRSKMEWIEECGFSSFTADRTGKSLSSGGDSELCLALKVAGFKIWYDDRMKFMHFIEGRRLTKDYIGQLKAGIRTSNFYTKVYLEYLNGYVPKVGRFYWVKELLYAFKAYLKSILSKDHLEVNRIKAFMSLLLRERSYYNQKVTHILQFCDKVRNGKYNG